jgi:hypothetical protein
MGYSKFQLVTLQQGQRSQMKVPKCMRLDNLKNLLNIGAILLLTSVVFNSISHAQTTQASLIELPVDEVVPFAQKFIIFKNINDMFFVYRNDVQQTRFRFHLPSTGISSYSDISAYQVKVDGQVIAAYNQKLLENPMARLLGLQNLNQLSFSQKWMEFNFNSGSTELGRSKQLKALAAGKQLEVNLQTKQGTVTSVGFDIQNSEKQIYQVLGIYEQVQNGTLENLEQYVIHVQNARNECTNNAATTDYWRCMTPVNQCISASAKSAANLKSCLDKSDTAK